MDQGVRRETIWCDSSDRRTRLHGYRWLPPEDVRPRAAVQLVHGMSEHIGRYDEFARFLAERGFVVFGHDLLGHGKSVASSAELGHLPIPDGASFLVDDIHRVRTDCMAQLGSEGLTDLPLFLFGHSLGSLAVRVYLARHAYGLAGALLFGTAFIPVRTAASGRLLAQFVARTRGETSHSKMLDRVFVGAFNQDIENPETPVDWISFNRENIERYLADERCGFSFTAGGYYALATLLQESCSSSCVASYPHDLPLLYVSGTEDPVGEYGQDVSRAADLAHGAGVQDVRCRLYAGMRHEVLNEKGHQVVFEDVANWIEGHLA